MEEIRVDRTLVERGREQALRRLLLDDLLKHRRAPPRRARPARRRGSDPSSTRTRSGKRSASSPVAVGERRAKVVVLALDPVAAERRGAPAAVAADRGGGRTCGRARGRHRDVQLEHALDAEAARDALVHERRVDDSGRRRRPRRVRAPAGSRARRAPRVPRRRAPPLPTATSRRRRAAARGSARRAACLPARVSPRRRDPRRRGCPRRSSACVDFPDPSTPSKVTNMRATSIGACGRSSPEGRASSARTWSMRSSRAATTSSSSTTSPPGGARTSTPEARLAEHDIRDDGSRRCSTRRSPMSASTSPRRPTCASRSSSRPRTRRSTSLGTVRVLEAARRRGAQVVFASTGGAIYGECDRPAVEGDPTLPVSPYGTAKLAGEEYLAMYNRLLRDEPRRPSLRQRLRAAAGSARRGGCRRDLPRTAATDRRAVPDLRRRPPDTRLRLRRRRRPRDARRGRARRRRSSTSAPASRRPCSISSSAAARSPAAARDAELAPARLGELQRSVLDPSRAERELGWRAETSLDDGLRATWESISAT